MLKISDAISDIVSENPFMQFGLQYKLMNLTQLAKYVEPLLTARVKKDIGVSAIVMALSRLQRNLHKNSPKREKYHISDIGIHTSLATFTFEKTEKNHKELQKFMGGPQAKNSYTSLSEGMREITVIIEESKAEKLLTSIGSKPLFSHKNISGVSIVFDKKYAQVPGMLYILMQQMLLQNINVIELSSTYTSLVIYVDSSKTQLAFDTLYSLFHPSQEERSNR